MGLQGADKRANGARIDSLRRAYFAQASEIAIRYSVLFDCVVDHVRWAEDVQPRRTPYSIRYVEDLVHAAACTEGGDLAWRDLVEQHERALVRSCMEHFDPTQAIVLVRQFLMQLRREERSDRVPVWSLRRYDGTRSLRRWLRDGLAAWTPSANEQPRLVLVAAEDPDPASADLATNTEPATAAQTPGWTAVNAGLPTPW